MARIVITSWGSYGDVYPYIGLAKALAKRGHHPTMAVPAYYGSLVEGQGIAFSPVGPDVDPNDRSVLARIMDPVKGSETILRELLLPSLERTYGQLQDAAARADLLVSHPITFAAPVLAEKAGLPWASSVLAPLSFFSRTDAPAPPPAPWLVHLGRVGLGRIIIGFARRATRGWMEPVYRLRSALGLPHRGDPLFEGQFSPMLTLALFSRLFADPQPDWPPKVEITGFSFYNRPGGLSPQLDAFLASGPAPVVFTLGSSAVGAAGTFYEESVRAAALLGVRAVLLTGDFAENRPAGMDSRDVFVATEAPHEDLFPRASVVVHQGGIGTTAQALKAGRPMLVVPHAHDQPDNAFRASRLGVSRTVYPGRYRAGRVARELKQLLNGRRYSERAAEAARQVRAERGAEAAADAIDRLIVSQRT
jgi:UDP:flavonoid glycosyltransferase YjiC (YdhE family)